MHDMVVAEIWFGFSALCKLVSTKEELADLLVRTYEQLGFAYVNISVMRDYGLPADVMTFGWKSTYPEDWAQYYAQRDCMRYDPVALCARGDVGPFFWANLKYMLHLTPLQTSLMGLADEAGLHNGIGLPFVGPNSRHGGIALATLSPNTDHLRDLDLLWCISNMFYKRLRELVLGRTFVLDRQVSLTPREADVLMLSGSGLNDRQIAENLHIGDDTVNSHFRKAYRKFGAHNRIHAYANAIKQQIIDFP
jgi:DNA-binding CsgD family transcriptional regulator